MLQLVIGLVLSCIPFCLIYALAWKRMRKRVTAGYETSRKDENYRFFGALIAFSLCCFNILLGLVSIEPANIAICTIAILVGFIGGVIVTQATVAY